MSDRTALTDIVPPVRQEPQHNQSISSRRSRYFLATSVTKKLDHNRIETLLLTNPGSFNKVRLVRACGSKLHRI